MFIYLFWERKNMCACEKGRGRKREREKIPSRVRIVSAEPSEGLKPTNHEIMTWAKIELVTQPTEPPMYPHLGNYFFFCFVLLFCFLFSFFKFIYLFWGRDRESKQRRGRERQREGKRENPEQAPHYQCRAWCGAWTHKLWDHDLSQNQKSNA